MIRHLAPDLITAAADAWSDQDIELIRLAAVGKVQRLHRLDRNAGQRAAPAGMCPGHDSPGAVEKEERKAVGVVGHDRLAGDIGGQGVGVEDALPAFRLPPMEGDDVGAMLLDGHQGTGEIEAQLVGELLAPLHHEVRIVRRGEAHRPECARAEPVPGRKSGDADDGGELQGCQGLSLAFRG